MEWDSLDEDARRGVFDLLGAARRAIGGAPEAVEEREKLRRWSGSLRPGDPSPYSPPSEAWKHEVEKHLRAAAALLRRARPDLSEYQAKAAVLAELRRGCPAARDFRFTPETRMVRPPDAPPCPPIDPRYADLRGIYMPQELVKAPPETLPDGAILPVLRCLAFPTNAYTFSGDGDGHDLCEPVLRRYGARLYPALVELLSDPASHTPPRGTTWMMIDRAILLAGELPREAAEKILRSALESGWGRHVRLIPEGPLKAALREEYADGPYGPPWAL